MAKKCIPLIDMEDSSNLSEKMVKACEEWGCFRMVDHGIPLELMAEMKAVTRSLMDLPMQTKLKNSHPEPGVDKYAFAVYDLAQFLGRKLMEGLGMEGEIFKKWPCQLKMNKYNYGPETVGLTGAVLHTDPGFLTILQNDENVNGLEAVDSVTGELVSVDPIPGTLVINVGDVAKGWSNGRFCNVKHRVQCYEAKIRTSIALFVLGPREEKVEAPPQLVDSDHPRRYVPFEFEEYRKLRVSTRSLTGETLEHFLAKTL